MGKLMDGTYFDRELETKPWSEIQEMTFEKARRQLERVYDVSPYYRKKYDAAGVHPRDVETPDDFARLPFFEKEEERESQQQDPPFGGHLCVDPEDIVRVHASSGTTGNPTFFGLTQRDVETWDRIMARVFYTAGLRSPDVMAALGNLSMFVGGIPVVTAAAVVGASAVPIGATAGTEKTMQLLEALGVTSFAVTPSFAGYLGELFEETTGTPASDLGLRLMMVGGEPGGQIPAVRQQIHDVWGCQIRDAMGIGEFAGVMWGESSDEDGMHFCGQAEMYLELIDPETGERKPFEDGARGELVYTAVEREACPLIRFRSRDHVLVKMGETPSGRTSPRITTLGRTDDMLIVRGINVFPASVRDVAASFVPRTTGHIRILLETPGPLVQPPVPIEVEVASDVPGNEHDDLAGDIEDRLKAEMNFRADVRLIPEGSLPRTSMKTQYIHEVFDE